MPIVADAANRQNSEFETPWVNQLELEQMISMTDADSPRLDEAVTVIRKLKDEALGIEQQAARKLDGEN